MLLVVLTVYTQRLPDVPIIPLLYPNFGREERDTILFLNNAFKDLKEPFVQLTDDPAKADYLLCAQNFPQVRNEAQYLDALRELSERHGKKIIVFWHGDSDDSVDLPNAVIFRTSMYASDQRTNEIAMPAYAEDLLGNDSLKIRSKSQKPVVGFCGWADYKNLKNRIGTILRNMLASVPSKRKGLSIRRETISILQSQQDAQTNFIIRSSYSGHRDTIRMNPEQARHEYRENLLNSDLALVVKGDGNYSYRFYEALSLGRVPLLIDTDCVLPLADRIDYDSFIVRVPYDRIAEMPTIVRSWWDNTSPEEFAQMQRRGREAYEKYLSVPAFLREAMQILSTRS